MAKNRELLILVTNDDGLEARGLKSLIKVVRPFGRVVVVAPLEAKSGMSHAITVKNPLILEKIRKQENLEIFGCNGTPVDCVKIALNQVLDKKPDLLVSGFNHGANSSVSIFYSGTMAAAMEGCINKIPSIGISLVSHNPDADLTATEHFGEKIINKVIENGLPGSICLNVNVPKIPLNRISGIKVCRQNQGHWQEEFDIKTDKQGKKNFWLTGSFNNTEPEAADTDEWALKNNYVSVVPTLVDRTCYNTIKIIKNWDL